MAEDISKLNLYQRINRVMGEVTYIQKKKSAGMQYSTVSHDDVTASLHDAIVKYGIVYFPCGMEITQDGNKTQVVGTIRFVNVDMPEEFFQTVSVGHGIDNQDKGPGKAVSYLVKYALLKTFGLETGDDPDNDQDVVHRTTPERATVRPAASKAAEPINYSGQDGDPMYADTRPATVASLLDSPGVGNWGGAITVTVNSVRAGVSKTGKPYELVKTQELGDLWNNSGRSMDEGGMYAAIIEGDRITDWKL
jgi:hypothetical protein